MTAFDVYLISTAGSLSEFFGIAVGISFICFIACLITMPMLLDFFDAELNKFPFKKILLWFVPSWVLCALLAMAIPDTKTLIAMYGISYVTQIDGVKDVPPELVKFIKKFMADYMEEK